MLDAGVNLKGPSAKESKIKKQNKKSFYLNCDQRGLGVYPGPTFTLMLPRDLRISGPALHFSTLVEASIRVLWIPNILLT